MEPITETITDSSANDIVESLFNSNDELIGYACKQIVNKNTVEPMDIIFYMDLLSPKDKNPDDDTRNQDSAIAETQTVLLRKISETYQIDPIVSEGIRCFDLPVDGSTWMVQVSIEKRDFQEVTIFGGCRELDWDKTTQDCKFYEGRIKGSYIGAIPKDENGVVFSDVVGVLEKIIDGPEIVQNLNGNYQTSFFGVPRVDNSNPNFQGGDEGRDVLKDPVNIKTSIEANQSKTPGNRKTITVVGGLLVACFSVAFIMVGWVMIRRRQSYRRNQHDIESADDEDPGLVVSGSYEVEKESTDNDLDRHLEGTGIGENQELQDDEPHEQFQQLDAGDYPNTPMSAEAIQMDLGNSLKGQLMGVHGERSSKARSPSKFLRGKNSAGFYEELGDNADEEEEVDSWAQTDGTIGSLELQLEPITAEV